VAPRKDAGHFDRIEAGALQTPVNDGGRVGTTTREGPGREVRNYMRISGIYFRTRSLGGRTGVGIWEGDTSRQVSYEAWQA